VSVILYSRVDGFGSVYSVRFGGRCLGVFLGFIPPFLLVGISEDFVVIFGRVK
jgi:hypothetical protein